MLHDALLFLVLALVAGALGVYGIAAVASRIAWVLFVMGLGLLIPSPARSTSMTPGRLGSSSDWRRAR